MWGLCKPAKQKKNGYWRTHSNNTWIFGIRRSGVIGPRSLLYTDYSSNMTTLEWSLNHSRARVRLRYRGSDTLNYGPYNTFDLASNIYSTPLQQQNIHNDNLITGKICGNLIQNYDFTNIPCYMEMEKPQTTNLQRKIKS